MMANRLGDLSPSSSRACGLEEDNDQNGLNGAGPADRDSQKATLNKVLEMPMYDNADLGSNKVQEINTHLNSFHDDVASPNLSSNNQKTREEAEHLSSTVIDQSASTPRSPHEPDDMPEATNGILAKLQQANNHYDGGEDSVELEKIGGFGASRPASLGPMLVSSYKGVDFGQVGQA